MIWLIIGILMVIIGLIFMPSREEQNKEKYRTKKEEYKNFRYDTKGSVDSLRRDYKTYCKFQNEEQEMKKQKSNISPLPFLWNNYGVNSVCMMIQNNSGRIIINHIRMDLLNASIKESISMIKFIIMMVLIINISAFTILSLNLSLTRK